MKICILTHTFPRFPGDIAAPFMDGVARGLVSADNEVFVLTPYSSKFKWKQRDLSYKLITYKYIWPERFHVLGYSETLTNDMGLPIAMWILSPFMYLFGFLALIKLINKEKIDVVNAHWVLPNGFIASLASLFTDVPIVSTLPGSDVYMVQKNIFFNILGRFATWKSKWITSNSGQLITDLAKATNINLGKKSSSIIYGVDPDKFLEDNSQINRLKKDYRIGPKDVVVLGVGRLVAKKGFRYLIIASKTIIKKTQNVIFVIVGDGDEKKFLEDLAKKLGVYDKFRFVGSIDYKNLIHYYNLADIFVLPSVRDEKGNLDDQSVSVIEAMSCGTPVITTDFPGYRSVIRDGESGYLVPEKDSKKISEKISFLVEDKKERVRIGKNARKDVVTKFSWRAIGEEYSKLFLGLTNKYYSLGFPKILDENERLRVGKQILGVLRQEVKDTKKLICLDVGASSGVISNFLSNFFKKVIGFDVDANAIDIAKSRFKRKNLEFSLVDVEEMHLKSNSIDVIVCNQVYNFVDHPQKLVNEIYRVLKPDGICFFGARNKYAIFEPQYNILFGSWFPKNLPFGKNYMSYSEIKNLIKKFEIKEYTTAILRNPGKFNFKNLEKYKELVKFVPNWLLGNSSFLMPNFIFILRKPK